MRHQTPFLVAPGDHVFNGDADAAVGFDPDIPKIIEAMQGLVVPNVGNERRSQRFVDDFARST